MRVLDDCLDLKSDPSVVAVARAFVGSRLRAWEASGDQVADAVLVVSELVTNAVRHARTRIQVRVAAEESHVRIEVHDDNSRLPPVDRAVWRQRAGVGLAVVAALASAWGIEQADDGKVVWAEIAPRRGVAIAPEASLELT